MVVHGHAAAGMINAAEDGSERRGAIQLCGYLETAHGRVNTVCGFSWKTDLQSPQDTAIIRGAAHAAATQQEPLMADVALTISTSKS